MRLIPTFGSNKKVDPNNPTNGMTLDALMAKQKSLLQAAPEAPQKIASPWQGASLLANTFVNSLQQKQAADQESAGRDLLSKAMMNRDPATGELTPEAQAQIMRLEPELGYKFIADAIASRRELSKPLTDTAKLKADLAAGRITQEDYDAAVSGGPAKLSDLNSINNRVTSDPSYKNMAQATPIWDSIKDAATRNDTQAELNMVIGMAKLFDPTSVVRQGETETIANTGNLPASITAAYKFLTAQPGGRLDPAVKAGLLREGASRMSGYYNAYQMTAKQVRDFTIRHGINPDDVVPVFADPNAPAAPPPEPKDVEVTPQPTTPGAYEVGKVYEFTDQQGKTTRGRFKGGDFKNPASWEQIG